MMNKKALKESYNRQLKNYDPNGEFITWHKNVNLNEVATHYQQGDAFVFASSCENMPNVLMENNVFHVSTLA